MFGILDFKCLPFIKMSFIELLAHKTHFFFSVIFKLCYIYMLFP